MGRYNKKQFAKMCGMATNELSVYLKRGKVVLDGEEIDSEVEPNISFLLKKGVDLSLENEVKQKVTTPVLIEKTAEKKPQKRTLSSESFYELDKKLKLLEAEKKEKEIQLLGIKEEKLRGEVIPTDLVMIVFAQHFKSIAVSFKNATEIIITNIGKKKKLSDSEVAEIRGDLIGILNSAIKESNKSSAKNIDNIVAEYSIKKGVGEKK